MNSKKGTADPLLATLVNAGKAQENAISISIRIINGVLQVTGRPESNRGT